MDLDFWLGKRVFLTGHTGFKGSWLGLWLQNLGADVTGYALPPSTDPNLFKEARVADGMNSIFADIRHLGELQRELAKAQPEIVFHMAAQPLVRYSYENPIETYATNVMGTVNLLEAVRHVSGIKAVVIVTSDKCYENKEWLWGYRESEPMGGFDPYSSSKGCAELITSAYRSSYFQEKSYAEHGVAIGSARAGNVIGGGDWAQDRLIPDILAAFERNEPVLIRNPQAIRPWQHVLEPLRGYLMLAERLYKCGPPFSGAWNFGPLDEDARTVEWIVRAMATRWRSNIGWRLAAGEHPHEAHWLKLDISKARNLLSWHPRLRLADALAMIVDWAIQQKNGANVRALTTAQINTYQNLIRQ